MIDAAIFQEDSYTTRARQRETDSIVLQFPRAWGIRCSGADLLGFVTGGSERWRVHSSGHLIAVADATYDFGASGATRPRDIYLSRNLVIGTAVTSGAWNGTAVGAQYGGTGLNTSASTGRPILSAGTWSIDANLTTHVIKTADEPVNNSVTLQNDDHLVFAMVAGAVYWIELLLLTDAPSGAADWKFGWTAPALATMFWGQAHNSASTIPSWLGVGTASTQPVLATVSETVVIGGTTGTTGTALWGLVRNPTNAGNLQFQWAQNTQTASDSKLLKDSFMRVTRLA